MAEQSVKTGDYSLTRDQAAEIVTREAYLGSDEYAKKLAGERNKAFEKVQQRRQMNRDAWLKEHPGKTEADVPNF